MTMTFPVSTVLEVVTLVCCMELLCFCQESPGVLRLNVVSDKLVSIGLASTFPVSAPVARISG